MCGILATIGYPIDSKKISEALRSLAHRGPDMESIWVSSSGNCVLAHKRLSIIDLSKAGMQPMSSNTGRYQIVLNGEIYNYLELKQELSAHYRFRTHTDTEVLIAAYEKWGPDCLNRLIGMFAFIIWDDEKQSLFAARDRFGVKPMYYATLTRKEIVFASEIKALHALGLTREPDPIAWASYLGFGLYDNSARTFWNGVKALPAGHAMQWRDGHIKIWKWYDLAERVKGKSHSTTEEETISEYRHLLEESVRLRFRSDVPVGINLSGGLDSSILLALVHAIQGQDSHVNAFTFITGDSRYDELPWVRQMLEKTNHPHHTCLLKAEEVPELARKVQRYQDEPFGGLPTLAYSKIFKVARELGVIVLLDGQGLDEQWAGYDYYSIALNKNLLTPDEFNSNFVQGSGNSNTTPKYLVSEFHRLAEPFAVSLPFRENLKNMQYRDVRYSKIPRALRFNDRISMMHSTELREPFLDHRLFELAFRQPADRKIRNGVHKWLLRKMFSEMVPHGIVEAPKRPLQTPQREWLRGVLRDWADAYIKKALSFYGNIWLDADVVMREWNNYCNKEANSSFYIFQLINLGLWCELFNG